MNDGGLFKLGICSSITLFCIEIGIFLFDFLSKNPQFQQPTIYLPLFGLLPQFVAYFVILGLIQNIIAGLSPKPFSIGFLIGDAIITIPLYWYAFNILPSVITGMVVGFLIVLGCLILRSLLEKPKQYDNWNQ